MKKITVYGELAYLLGVVLLSLSIAMLPAAGFGLSMLAAPAFLVSERFAAISFGQADYIVEGLLLLLFFVLMRRVKLLYLASFVTCLFFGAMLDFWRAVVPMLNPAVTEPGSMVLGIRLALFAGAVVLGAFAIALMFRTYLYPQMYELFVKGISERYRLNRGHFKIAFDGAFLLLSVGLSFLLFGRLQGVGIGTLLLVPCNGLLIGQFDKLFERVLQFKPAVPKFARIFELK